MAHYARKTLYKIVDFLQVGAISPQGLEPLIQSIHDCLNSSDWATRKADADALNVLALHSSNLITGKMVPTITALEDCRFDKSHGPVYEVETGRKDGSVTEEDCGQGGY